MNFETNIWDREKYLKAWHFASIKHSGQKYGGHEPGQQIDYITHIGQVAIEVIWAIGMTKTIYNANLAVQCALLHDVLEDTQTTLDEIKTEFGQDVANGVLALTKNEKLPTKEEQMNDSLSRIKAEPKEIWMVKLADRISNLYRPPFYWDHLKISKYIIESEMIFDELHVANDILAKRLLDKIEYYKTNYKKS